MLLTCLLWLLGQEDLSAVARRVEEDDLFADPSDAPGSSHSRPAGALDQQNDWDDDLFASDDDGRDRSAGLG
jgi:hypothetical protein